jgi:hypothetical protein
MVLGRGFPVGFELTLGLLHLTVAKEKMIVSTQATTRLQWRDERLFSSECHPALPFMLSLSTEEAQSAEAQSKLQYYTCAFNAFQTTVPPEHSMRGSRRPCLASHTTPRELASGCGCGLAGVTHCTLLT